LPRASPRNQHLPPCRRYCRPRPWLCEWDGPLVF